jgi:glycosyltransferase involved in cell wall biosynthesis
MLLSDFKVKADRVKLIRNIPRSMQKPSEEEIKSFKRSLQLSEDDYIAAGIGRLHPEKGFDVLLNALKIGNHKDIKLILAGKGNEKEILKNYTEVNKLNVIFIDEIKNVELLYAIADVIIIPSRRESVSLVAIEAGHFQKPVIASSVGGLKETIKNGITGLSVIPEDPNALSQAIRKLYNDRQFCQMLGRQLSDFIEKEYAADKISDQVELVYKQLIQAHGRS